jgi:CheY-like chemotaxis protein
MGGDVTATSVPGQGATFTFTAAVGAAAEAVSLVSLDGIRVMVASPVTLIREATAALIEGLGGRADQVADIDRVRQLLCAPGAPICSAVLLDGDWGEDRLLAEAEAILGARADNDRDPPALFALLGPGQRASGDRLADAGFRASIVKPLRERRLARALAATPGETTAAAAHSTVAKDYGLQGIRILLADDDAVNTLVARLMLERYGCLVTAVANGRQAVEAVDAQPFDLVLMDCQMPEMDGYDATRAIRATGRFDALPIIALTASAMTGDHKRSLDAGMNDHITKPIKPETLRETVARWLLSISAGSSF